MIKANRSDHTAARGAMSSEVKGGLEDVVVSTSDICFIDGQRGRLLYRGYDVNDLVEHSSFEEVVYLLWHGALPSRKELDAHVKVLSATATRKLPPGLLVLLRALPKKTTPMEVLRTGVSALSAFDPDAADNSRRRRRARRCGSRPRCRRWWRRGSGSGGASRWWRRTRSYRWRRTFWGCCAGARRRRWRGRPSAARWCSTPTTRSIPPPSRRGGRRRRWS